MAVASATTSGTCARTLTRHDIDAAAQTLARAFHDDPLMCFVLLDDATRPSKMPRLFRLLVKLAVPYGACDMTDGFEAVALWRPPGRWHIPLHQYLANGLEFLSLFGVPEALRVLGVMDQIEKHHPKAPHYYLQIIGTDTEKQGKGFGGMVMRRQLEVVDRHGLPAYLESSKERNIPIYNSFGFEVTGEIRLKGGPTLHAMWRKARA